jgi:hypothetical protein
MKYAHCCSELEKLAHPSGAGLGLAILANKRGARFFLEYRKDWLVSAAKIFIEIKFCPYCGSRLTGPSSMREEISN